MTPAVALKSLGFTPSLHGDGYRRRGTSSVDWPAL